MTPVEINYTYIVLVNWNGWRDTLECLESVFKLSAQNFRVIVCDNGSTDSSLEKIKKWAEGDLLATASRQSMGHYSFPAHDKPIPYTFLNKHQAENNTASSDNRLILIDCEQNLGFAGGNNVGLRYSLQQKDMRSAWLLNNDTVIDSDALASLEIKMKSQSDMGIVGSTLIYYHQPEKVQAFGGARYFSLFGVAMHIGRFRNQRRQVDEARIEKEMDYVMGASMFISRPLLESVGLMSEDYFLYYEELDWALRARGLFKQGYAQNSLVFHKAGSTIGSSNRTSERSLLSDYFLMKNRLKLTKKFYPEKIITVQAFLLLEAVLRILQKRRTHAYMIWNLVTGQLNKIEIAAKP
jgi:GT2 family glycosyltransferase